MKGHAFGHHIGLALEDSFDLKAITNIDIYRLQQVLDFILRRDRDCCVSSVFHDWESAYRNECYVARADNN